MPSNRFDVGLGRVTANYTALSPLSFLRKAAQAFPEYPAIVYGELRQDWRETYANCRRLAGALAGLGIGRGDTVAVIAPNTPAVCELHFAVPMLGAVLLTMNIRLDAAVIAFQLEHGGAKVLFVDREFSTLATQALTILPPGQRPDVIGIDDADARGGEVLGKFDYKSFLAVGDPDFAWSLPEDEWDAISLNYTSGTTGNPKGVVSSHRGAYLNALNNVFTADVRPHSAYLWTVPLFHCNGWCFAWTMAAVAGVNVCLRRVEPVTIFGLMRRHGVTQMSGAPIVYNMLISASPELHAGITGRVTGTIGGAAPPSSTVSAAAAIGIDLVHIYGLTETYGPAAVCPVHPGWCDLPTEERAHLIARQGFATLLQEDMVVMDPDTMRRVPPDGETVGEIMFRGNAVMKGYLGNPLATNICFAGGWFHSGDLAVVEPDGYARIKDRSKDLIISGGENISSIEIEDVFSSHPSVSAVAVIAAPDAKWGEVPCAVIELRDGTFVTEIELLSFARARIAGYKMPRKLIFATIPRTSTGKAQKHVLREQVRMLVGE